MSAVHLPQLAVGLAGHRGGALHLEEHGILTSKNSFIDVNTANFHTKNCQTKNLWVKIPKSLC